MQEGSGLSRSRYSPNKLLWYKIMNAFKYTQMKLNQISLQQFLNHSSQSNPRSTAIIITFDIST